jgi:FkbM family methyltransferase
MNSDQEKHFNYTIKEWSENYYLKVIEKLKDAKIKTFIDLGANVGGVTENILSKIPSIEKCYLIEPDINNYYYLYDKFEKNNKVELLNCGIFYGLKRSSMTKRNNNIGGWSLTQNDYPDQKGGKFSFFELEFFNFGNIDFAKIDIEWAEYNVLENSKILKNIEFLEIEFHNGIDINYINKILPNYKVLEIEKINIFLQKENDKLK